jgi:hypothetical protein
VSAGARALHRAAPRLQRLRRRPRQQLVHPVGQPAIPAGAKRAAIICQRMKRLLPLSVKRAVPPSASSRKASLYATRPQTCTYMYICSEVCRSDTCLSPLFKAAATRKQSGTSATPCTRAAIKYEYLNVIYALLHVCHNAHM